MAFKKVIVEAIIPGAKVKAEGVKDTASTPEKPKVERRVKDTASTPEKPKVEKTSTQQFVDRARDIRDKLKSELTVPKVESPGRIVRGSNGALYRVKDGHTKKLSNDEASKISGQIPVSPSARSQARLAKNIKNNKINEEVNINGGKIMSKKSWIFTGNLEELFEALKLDTDKYTGKYLAEQLGFKLLEEIEGDTDLGDEAVEPVHDDEEPVAETPEVENEDVFPEDEHAQAEEVEEVIVESVEGETDLGDEAAEAIPADPKPKVLKVKLANTDAFPTDEHEQTEEVEEQLVEALLEVLEKYKKKA